MLAAYWLVLLWALFIVFCDVKARRIPNELSLGVLLVGLIYAGYTGHAVLAVGWPDIGLGLLLAVGLTVPAYLQRWLGAGDVKLLLAIGILGGWKAVLVSFVAAGLLSGVSIVAMLQYATYSGRSLPTGRWLPFGAMLAIGFMVSMGFKW
ncbi:MAG TPA: prepilin peptidase [Methylophilaceae bacterium]|nr:prepilin peptidase [Methylophilaceae bacterium]